MYVCCPLNQKKNDGVEIVSDTQIKVSKHTLLRVKSDVCIRKPLKDWDAPSGTVHADLEHKLPCYFSLINGIHASFANGMDGKSICTKSGLHANVLANLSFVKVGVNAEFDMQGAYSVGVFLSSLKF